MSRSQRRRYRVRPEVADVIETYAGIWSFRALGRKLGLSARTVENYCRWLGVRPTDQRAWWTSGAAAEYTGYSPQHLTSLARAGRVRARRNPSYAHCKRRAGQRRYRPKGRGWWLFDPADLERLRRPGMRGRE